MSDYELLEVALYNAQQLNAQKELEIRKLNEDIRNFLIREKTFEESLNDNAHIVEDLRYIAELHEEFLEHKNLRREFSKYVLIKLTNENE